jgi:hypothetical protein
MFQPITETEAEALRALLLLHDAPADSDFEQISLRPVSELRHIARQSSAVLRDPFLPVEELTAILNSPVSPTRLSRPTTPLPPKARGKVIAKAASPTVHPFSRTFPMNARVPLLPRIASGVAPARATTAPAIGTLAAVLHPQLGPVHVCRVLARRIQNDTEYFLVAFFQGEQSPCLVPAAYLFELRSRLACPIGDEAEFGEYMAKNEVSVDWLLERIFIAAQVLVINQAEVLYPGERNGLSPQQMQQRMFQCVSCAALMIVCYIAGRWRIPTEKMGIMISTIMKTNPAKFVSAQNVMARVEREVAELLTRAELENCSGEMIA